MYLRFGAATDPGRVRARNEDRFVADGDLGFFAVIDGMGGHAGGEQASATIAEATTAFIRETAGDSDKTWPIGIDPRLSGLANRLQVAVRSANRTLATRVQENAALEGGGATLAAALFGGEKLVVSNGVIAEPICSVEGNSRRLHATIPWWPNRSSRGSSTPKPRAPTRSATS